MTQEFRVDGVLYRQQYRKCGKPGCKCAAGEPHGPYWYSYDGQSAAKYVGQLLPTHVTDRAQLLKANAATIKKLKQELTKKSDEHLREYNLAGRQLRTVEALETGEHCDSAILQSLGLSKFNGHKE